MSFSVVAVTPGAAAQLPDSELVSFMTSNSILPRVERTETQVPQQLYPELPASQTPAPHPLRPRERQQRRHIIRVGGFQRCDVVPSQFLDRDQAPASPRHARSAEPDRQEIGGEAGEATVAVGKRVDEDEAVVKAHGDFVGRVGVVRDPISDVVEELTKVRFDMPRLDADIARRRAVFARPCPYGLEHPPVEPPQKSRASTSRLREKAQRSASAMPICSASLSSRRSVM